MISVNLSVADRKVRLVTNGNFNPLDYFSPTDSWDLELELINSAQRQCYFANSFRKLRVEDEKIGHHIARQVLANFSCFHSEEYNAVHASGFLAYGKGVLAVGKSGSGKSTISKSFLNSQVLDDDLLIISRNQMFVTGKVGSITVMREGLKRLDYQHQGVKRANLDIVFLLDPEKEGGFIKEVGMEIPRRYSLIGSIPTILQKIYRDFSPIQVDAPVYLLGTNGNLEATIKRIEDLVV